MKTLVTLLFIAASFTCKAQMQSLFFNEDELRGSNIADSITAILPGFKADSMYPGKSEKNFTIILRNDAADKIVVSFSVYYKKIYLCSITGKLEYLLRIYVQYFNSKLTKQQIVQANCAPLLLVPLPNKKQLPVSFCNNGKSWTIRSTIPN